MLFVTDLVRFLREVITSEQFAHTVQHMSRHAFQHFMRHYAPHLWEIVKDNIGEVFEFVKEWIVSAF